MDVESLLRSAQLPEVSVDAEDALTATLQRGMRRRRRRRGTGALAAVAVVVVVGLIGAAAVRQHGGTEMDLATGPSAGPTVPSGEPEPGDPATWDIDPAAPPSPESSTFTALVTRIDCNSGVTGTVLRPGVEFSDIEITVTFKVATVDGDRDCPANDAVPYLVDLGQPIGDRDLVDPACTDDGVGSSATYCTSAAGVRWRADGSGTDPGEWSVRGRMVSVGGPAGAQPDPAPGAVRVLGANGDVVSTGVTDAAGWFVLSVPSGTYRIVGRSSAYQGGAEDCVATSDLVVDDRAVDGITVECHRD